MNDAVWIRYYQNGRFDGELTFAEVQNKAEQLPDDLVSAGLAVGDRVIVNLQNSPQAVISYLALRRAGMIAVPVNPKEPEEWLTFVRNHSDARAMITEQGTTVFSSPRDDKSTPMAGQVMTIVYTSGTTGAPKGVCLGWSQWKANALALNAHHRLTSKTIHASPLPLYHCNAHGFSMFSTYLAKCRWILFNKVTPEFLDIINREQVEIVSLVPALLARLVRENPNWRPHTQ